MFTGEGDHGVGVQLGARQRDDERLAHLAQSLIGHPDDGGLGDAVEAGEYLLDLGGVDVEPPTDVHVFEAVGDLQVARRVQLADVPGVQPSLVVDRGSGGLGVIEVAQHHVGPAQQHLPLLPDAQLEVGDRPTGRGGHGDGVVVGAAHGAEAAGFGQPVGGEHDVDVEFALHPLDQHDRDRGCTGDRESQGAEVIPTAFGMVEEGLIDRRRAG